MVRTVEQSAMRKVYLRILPFAVLTYFFCYLDRINVGFAALTMNKDIGLDPAMYGMAAGAFFWGYVLFEVPSNIILDRPSNRDQQVPRPGCRQKRHRERQKSAPPQFMMLHVSKNSGGF